MAEFVEGGPDLLATSSRAFLRVWGLARVDLPEWHCYLQSVSDGGVESEAQLPPEEAPNALPDDGAEAVRLARLRDQGLEGYAGYLGRQEQLIQLVQSATSELLRSVETLEQPLDAAAARHPAAFVRLSERVVGWVGRNLGARMGLRVDRLFDRLLFWDVGAAPRQDGDRVVWRSRYGPRKHRLVVPRNASRSGGWRYADWRRTPSDLELQAQVQILLWDCPALEELLSSSPDTAILTDGRQAAHELPAVDLVIVGAARLLAGKNGAEAALLRRCVEVGCPCAIWLTSSELPSWNSTVASLPEGVLRLASSFAVARAAEGMGRPWVPIGPTSRAFQSDRAWVLGSRSADHRRLFWLETPGAPASVSWRTALEPAWTFVASVDASDLERALVDAESSESTTSLGLLVVNRNLHELTEPELELLVDAMARRFIAVVPPQVKTPPPLLAGAPLIISDLGADTPALLARPDEMGRMGQLSWRFSRSHFSRAQAARRLTAHTGIHPLVSGLPLVSVICVSRRPERLARCLELFRQQTYPRKELIVVANLDALAPEWVEMALADASVTLLRTDAEHSLGASLNRARAFATGDLWAKMDDDDYYGPSYLADQVLALEESEAAVVGKGTFYTFVEGPNRLYLTEQVPEHSFSEYFVHGGTIVADRRSVEGIEFSPVERGTDTLFLQQCRLLERRIYSTARFGFAYFRYSSGGHHTFDVPSSAYLKNSRLVAEEFDLTLVDV